MGDTATRLTWSVSLVTLLPLVYAAFMPQLLEEEKESDVGLIGDQGSTAGNLTASPERKPLEEEKQYYPKQGLHFKLFLLCWALSVYPFMSKMAGIIFQALYMLTPELTTQRLLHPQPSRHWF